MAEEREPENGAATDPEVAAPDSESTAVAPHDGTEEREPANGTSADPEGAAPEAESAAAAARDGEIERLRQILESVLFAAAAPITLRRLTEIVAGAPAKHVQRALAALLQEYAPGRHGIQLHEVAGGYQFRTARDNAEWVRAVFKDKPARLGRAALETLAVVAYKQPVTRAEIEAVRGVDVDAVLNTLLSRRLIKIAGRKETVGRPLLYCTTPEFLETFGLKDLKELPSLKELGPADGVEEETAAAVESHARETQPDAGGASTERQATLDEAGDLAATATTGDVTGTEEPARAEAPGSPANTTDDASTEVLQPAPGTAPEDPQPGGDCLTAGGGGADPGGPGAGERQGGDHPGDESDPANGSDHR